MWLLCLNYLLSIWTISLERVPMLCKYRYCGLKITCLYVFYMNNCIMYIISNNRQYNIVWSGW